MTLAVAEGYLLNRKRVSVLLLTGMMLISYFIGMDMNARAQADNVYVDGLVLENGSGAIIENATVILRNTEDGTTNNTKTNSTGYYNISIYTRPGGQVFEVTAFHEDYLIASQYIWLNPGNPQNLDFFLDKAMNKNSYVHGEIYDAITMTPLPFVGIAALGENYINTTSSDPSGYYWMALQSDQEYYVQAEMDGYEDQVKSSTFEFGVNRTFNFYLEPMNCTLKGYIKNPGGPLGFASVQVYRLGDPRPTQYYPEVNSTTGYFELNLSRGVWHVQISEGMHYSQTLSVLMFNGKTTWQNFTLSKLPTESATVQGYARYYHNGSGVPWASINAQNQNRTWNGFNSSNETGWYEITVLPGEISLDAWSNQYGAKQTTITAQDGKTHYANLTLIDFWSYGYLEGYVRVGGIGEPDVGVIVSYGNWRNEDRTDALGYYNISVPGGPLEVQAYKDGFKNVITQVNTTAFATNVLDMVLEPLDWSCEIRGYINDTNGKPIEGAYASFDYDGYGWDSATAVTDYTGLYQRMAPAGEASTFIFADGYEYKTGNVDLPANQIFWYNETLGPVKDDASIICKFTDIYTGKPIKHAEITFSEQDLVWFSREETDKSGMLKADVPPGFVRVSIRAWDSGYKEPGMYQDSSAMQFRLKPSEIKWLNISLFPREKSSLLHGFVNDTGFNPIQGATVYVQYGDTIIENITDISGYYELGLPGDHSIQAWVRAPGYRIMEYSDWIGQGVDREIDLVLLDSPAWIENPITDSVVDLDGDTKFDYMYVNVTINIDTLGDYRLEGYLSDGRNSQGGGIARAEVDVGDTLGLQVITLAFKGEQIRQSKENGYYVDIELFSTSTWERYDRTGYFTTKYGYDEFEVPDAIIEKPVEQWLVDTDLDGLYNYLIINVTLNVSVAEDYTLLGPMRDIWGDEFEMAFESFSLETGLTEVQISYDGTAIFNNQETIGSIYLVLFDEFPDESFQYIHTLFFYTPYDHEIFQFYEIDSFISGNVTDKDNIPIEGINVWIYNITQKFLNETTTDSSGYYELGGWSGDWILVVNDYEGGDNQYQGDLTEISLSTGMATHDFLNLPDTMLDEIEMQLIFSDWNNTRLDWLLYAIGDNKTIRFEMDVLQFGNGDGFVSEEEVEYVMGMIGTLNLPDNSNESFLVDGIWYDLNQSSVTRDAGLAGYITSTDPVYIHLTGDYVSNATIPDPSPHDFTLNCSYDDTDSGSFIGNNVTNIFYVTPPSEWGRTGNGIPQNVTISGSDYITADPLNDPNPGDSDTWEWLNITISIGETPTVGTIKGNVTLQGSLDHSGVVVTIYDNATQQEIASAPTNPGGYFEVPGLVPGTYDIVAHKAGYGENRTDNVSLSSGDVLWFDFTLFSYPPTITHTPIVSNIMDDPIEVLVDVTDDGEVDEVILFYKDVGSGSYSSISMSQIPSTSTFMGTIPAQSQIGYVYYYIWANDTKGNSAIHPASGNHSIFIYETNPPEFSNVIVSPNPAEYPAPVNISVVISDDTVVEYVTLFLEKPDSSTSNDTMDYDPVSGRYYVNASYTQLGTYNYTIWANDSFDNWNSSSGSFVVQDTISPTSSVDWISQYWHTSSPIPVDATASDSGIGVDFVELYYRYSPDNFTWTMWSSYQTDSSSPYQYTFAFPDGEGYYEFFSIATDYAQNPEAMKASYETLVGYDISSPISSVEIIDTYWQTTSPLTINATASETISSIENVTLWYRHSTDNSSWGSWMVFGADTTEPYSWSFNFPEGEGFYEFFSIASDIVGNSEPMKGVFEALCGYDISLPNSNVDVIDTYWRITSPITINATASDTASGVKSVELYYRYASDNSSWGLWTAFGTDSTAPYQWAFDFPDGQGYYEFFCIANDSADHVEVMKSSSEAICGYDTSMPTSYVQPITPYLQTSSPISLDVTASDTVGGVVSVDLWYRYSEDNSNWGLLTIYDTDSTFPWSFSFDFPDGEGYYEFSSTATDLAGLTEGVPFPADTSCVYDTTYPAFLTTIELPDPWELGDEYNLSIQITDVSGIDSAWMDITLGGVNIGNYSMDNLGQEYWYSYAPMDIGALIIKVSAVDTNGLWNSVSYSTDVTDTTPPVISDFEISPTNPQVKSNIRVDVNVSDYADITSVRIEVTSPDDIQLFNESMTYDSQTGTYYHENDYTILGDYEIVIWAVDENGHGTKYTDTLTTQDTQPPSADAGPDQVVTAGTTVTLNAQDSTDNYNITNYTWKFNDNGLKQLYGKVVSYTFNDPDNYNINLTVRDESGNSDSDTTWVNVSAVSNTGTITGTVRDENGNPIQGATVYLESDPSIDNVTDSLGRFSLANVPVGNQTIIVEKDGYKWASREVDVEQDQNTPVGNIELAKSVSDEGAPIILYGAIIAIVVIIILILLLLLMQKKKAAAAGTVIDEVFFMYNDGRLIKHFTRRLKPDMDEDILSSMLVAVQDFVKDSFKDQEGILDEMKFGRFQVLLGRGKHIILATVVLGEEVEPFRPQIAKCVEDIEEKYGDVLEDWDGEMASVRGAAKYIVDLIDGKYA